MSQDAGSLRAAMDDAYAAPCGQAVAAGARHLPKEITSSYSLFLSGGAPAIA